MLPWYVFWGLGAFALAWRSRLTWLALLQGAVLHLAYVPDPEIHGLAWNYLRAALQTLGTGRRPVLEELAVAVAFLNAAGVLAAQRAGRAGRSTVDADAFAEGLMEAVDLTHADSGGLLGRLLGTLSGGVEALYLFAGGEGKG